ncbi:MAG TPA: diacylglycerol kinase family protein, partial [Chloroflexota bacterium]|nr:diacylglycerol kinase family protein [Chloroflexota bacterium]
MRVGVIANPRAGRGRAVDLAKRACQELTGQGIAAELACSEGGENATELARAMSAAGCQLIFAAGGDGTINDVVQGIAGMDCILGVVPAGLANVWAADVGLSSRAGAFGALVRDGLVFDTDIGIVNGRYFLEMAGIGFDAAVVAGVTPKAKARWAQLAYVREALRCAWQWEAPVSRVTVD